MIVQNGRFFDLERVIFENFKTYFQIALYGAAQTISDRSLVDEILRLYLSSLYFTE